MPGENDIEDRIISDVESNTGDNFSPEPSGGEDGGQTSAEPTTSREPTNNRDRSEGFERNRKEVQPKEKGKPNGKDTNDELRPDGKGNLVDREGNVVAARGAERRVQQQNVKLKETNHNLMNEVAQLRHQVEQGNALRGLPQQLGLNQKDMSDALKIAGQMKRDPVVGARLALQYALSQGADLSSIVQAENLQNINLSAQRQMMEEFHNRTYGPQMQERQSRQVIERAKQHATRFQAEYGDYEDHFSDVAKMIPEMMSKAQREGRPIDEYTAAEMSLQMLQNYAMQNGLDPRRSINDQIEEIRSNPQRRNASNQPRRPAPMPNGSRGGVDRSRGRSGSFPPNTSTDAIVRQAMIEAGHKFG